MSKEIKNCTTCGHRRDSDDYCLLSGYSCRAERHYPTVCGRFYQGWTPRPSLIVRIYTKLFGGNNGKTV